MEANWRVVWTFPGDMNKMRDEQKNREEKRNNSTWWTKLTGLLIRPGYLLGH